MNWAEVMLKALYYNRQLGYKAYRVKGFPTFGGKWIYGIVGARRGN